MTHGSAFFSAVSGAPWDDVAALARLLGVTLSPKSVTLTRAHARALWKELSYLGSNNLAYVLRGFQGVDYPEVVRDVCKQLSIAELQPGEAESVVEQNEQLVLAKLFADDWERLDTAQRRELLRELNLDEGQLPLAGAAVAAALLDGSAGPFGVYKLSRIVASFAARALPARGLARARRKAAQAVVLVASLRQAQRTALAETVLAGSEPLDEPPADRTARRRRGKPSSRGTTARRPPEQLKKKADESPRAAPKRNAKKKITAKKTMKRKKTAKKAIGTSKNAKKSRTTKRR